METHAMKLPERSFYADLNGRGGLKLCSYWIIRALATFAHYAPLRCALWLYVVWHLVAKSLWFINTSTLQQYHLQLIVDYVGGKKFHKLTSYTGGILLQYHT